MVHGSLEKRLSVIEFILINIREKLGQLIVAISSITIVLDLKVAVTKQRETSPISRLELKFA